MRSGSKNILGNLQAPKINQLMDNVLLNAFDIAINGSLTQHGMIDGIRDAFVDESGIDTVNSENQIYDASGDYYYAEPLPGGITADTLLLIDADGGDTSGQQHIPTYVGTAKIEASVYKLGTGSILLDGNSDYLTVPDHADWNFGSGDFTVDFWIKKNANGSSQSLVSQGYDAITNYSFNIVFLADNTIQARVYYGSTRVDTTSTGTITDSTWHHIAFVRDGATMRLFIDGVADGTGNISTNSLNNSTTTLNVGYDNDYYFNGYIDEVRVSNTARWTTGFTPPTEEYTSDANTKLLLHLNDDLTDSGNTGHTVTAVGTARVVASKFGVGHLLVDGSGDYIEFPDSDDWSPGAEGDWTFDCWYYFANGASTDATRMVWYQDNDDAGTSPTLRIFHSASTGWGLYIHEGVAGHAMNCNEGSVGSVEDMWQHLAVVCEWDGSAYDYYIFVNGTQVATTADSPYYHQNAGGKQFLGANTTDAQYWKGYLDEIRWSKEARWITSFTPPTEAYTTDANTKLLLHFEGGDQYGQHSVEPQGTAQVDRTTYKWGSGAWKFDGDSDYLELADSSDWDIGGSSSDNWTIDLWVKHTDHAGLETYVCQWEDNSNKWVFYNKDSDGMKFQLYSGGVAVISLAGTEISDTDWHHVALIKVADEYGIYLDGTQTGYVQDTSTDTFAGVLRIGAENSQWYMDGNIDELRIQHANYFTASPVVGLTDTITVPTEAYTEQSGVLDMTLISNSVTAEAEPDNARLVIFEEDVDAVTLNTDLKAWVSKDGGSTWAQVTLENKGEYDTDKNILAGSVDLDQSGIGSGTSMEYKITTHNSKELKIHGMGELWDA